MFFEDADELFSRMALSLVENIGPKIAKSLIAHCGSAKNVFHEKRRSLQKIPDVGLARALSLASFNDFKKAEMELEYSEKNNIKVCSFTSEHYPERLKQCSDSPLILFSKGEVQVNPKRVVAVVGTRNASDYGRLVTTQLIRSMKETDVCVVSGLAYGTDINAHQECINEGISTVAVLAHGLDRIYPHVHKKIAIQMLENGGWVTEHFSETIPDRENFPKRNRIIAGLSDAVIVVEAAKKGGALITAEIANSYNRDVFAVPGDLNKQLSEGCNMLIKIHKAALLQSVEDLIYIMGWDKQKNPKPVQSSLMPELSNDEQLVYTALTDFGKLGVDAISDKTGMIHGKLAAVLLNMELRGVIRMQPGKTYEAVKLYL